MKKTFPFLLRGVLVLAAMSASLFAEQEPVRAVAAEVWNFDMPEGVSAKSTFEQWRAQQPSGESKQLALDGLALPAREENTMVRVAGVLIAPVSGHFAFTIHAPDAIGLQRPDESELWIHDETTGEWRLAQCTGNPVKTGGRTYFEAGNSKRFELWTMGRTKTVVQWHVTEFGKIDPATGRSREVVPRQTVPASAIGLRTSVPDDKLGDGLPDSWQSRHGLDPDYDIGPHGPWGDPDGDGLPNWRERTAGTNPQVADVEGRDGLVRWETWRGIPGRYVFDLRRAGHFPNGPHEVRFLDRLEVPAGIGERCGSRLRGWLVAPADGEYRIGISAEDEAELWLGENETWQSKRLIARGDHYVHGRLRWFQRDEKGVNVPLESVQTGRVALKAGTRYYLEILHKQDTGPDHCFVAWIKPGAQKPEVITKEHLVSWKPCPTDTDDDGLPDEWQRTAKLMDDLVDPAMRQAEADPDLDGATNREEWLAGTDPLSKTESPPGGHLLTSETWTGIAGRSVSSLTGDGRYPAKPDFASRIDNLDFGNEGENYGVRLRGYLTAPKDGDYQFSISGNNACTLYLAASEDKFTKRVASRVEVGTLWRSFDLPGHSPSGPIPMESGKSYYIEVIYKRGVMEENKTPRPDPGDHSSVAWKRPGERSFSVIPPGVFTSYQPDPRDLDDDDLPDDWEKLHRLDPATPGGDHGAWGDPDGDGLDNFREYQLGLDPNATDVHGTPGLALYEAWDNIPGLPDAHREQSGLIPALHQEPRFPLEPSRREWRDTLEAPRRQGNDYGGRLRAHIMPPVTGDYLFSIAGRDVGILFFSADGSKFNRKRVASIDYGTTLHSWDKRPGQVSAPVRLEAGKPCYIEALVGRGGFRYNDDFFSIAWKPPGADKFEVIGSEHLVAFFRDPNDQDDDELPDDWEKRYGLDSSDPHGDNGPHGDPDRDGMTNMEEYQLGTDPRNGDTDGDGVSDADELRVYGSDPLVKDAVPPELHVKLPLNSPLASGQRWITATSDGAIQSLDRRGTTEWEFVVEEPGIYQIALYGWSATAGTLNPGIRVSIEVDGVWIGEGDIMAGPKVTRLPYISQWLRAGSHRLILTNQNVRTGVSLVVSSIDILAHAGEDSDGNGMPDWLEHAFRETNRTIRIPLESATSPACIEGHARYLGGVSLLTGKGEAIEAMAALQGRWFADVPLEADGSMSKLHVSFEDGAITEIHDLAWSATNLSGGGEFHVRLGDSMRLTAFEEDAATNGDAFQLSAGGIEIHKGVSTAPFIFRFENEGRLEMSVETIRADGVRSNHSAVFHVTGAELGPDFDIPSQPGRRWMPVRLSGQTILESDKHLSLLEIAGPEGAPRAFHAAFSMSEATSGRVIARLPGGGPVLDAATIHGFQLASSTRTGDHQLIAVLPDGTRVIRVGYVINGRIPSDLLIWIQLYVPDAVFANGSAWLRLTAADFDENGGARFDVYKAPGTGVPYVCHWIRPYGEGPLDSEVQPVGDGAETENETEDITQ